MSRKRYTPEQIISMLREAEVLGAGPVRWSSLSHARRIGAELPSLAEYGGLRTDQAKRLPGEGEWPSPEGDLGSDVG